MEYGMEFAQFLLNKLSDNIETQTKMVYNRYQT